MRDSVTSRPNWGHVAAVGVLLGMLSVPATAAAAQHLRLSVPRVYLADLPVLARVDVLTDAGEVDRGVWDATVDLTVDPASAGPAGAQITLRNGAGNALVTLSGTSNVTLTARWAGLEASQTLTNAAGAPVTTVAGTLSGSSSTWSGVVRVTSDVTVPVGHTLTIQPNTLVLLSGVASGTAGADLVVQGTLRSLGTESGPVQITCADPGLRWGQIRHQDAAPSIYTWTTITRGGRAPGEGHTGTGPVVRTSNSRLTFWNCALTDHADASGGPGKIMMASGSDLLFSGCHLSRARMGPEIEGTALWCQDTWITDMIGPDDADGIYVHTQAAGQRAVLSGCVLAVGNDDGLDTLGATVDVEDSIIRDWANPLEDAKGISVFHGTTTVRRSLIAGCYVGVAAKSSGPEARVVIDRSTITGITQGISAVYKDNATAGNIRFEVTNSIVRGTEAVHTDFDPVNGPARLLVGFCNLATPWTGRSNFVADPGWVHATTNHHLLAASPCVDAGDAATGLDPDGTPPDLGAFPRWTPGPPPAVPSVVLNEIMFHPASEDIREEFIEVFNRGPEPADLSGWTLTRGVEFAFPNNLTLPAGGHLIVAADLAVFTAKYPGVTPVLGGWAGRLSNNRNEIVLEDAAGRTVDAVTYVDEGDWALRQRGPLDLGHRGWTWYCPADGLGASLERIQPGMPGASGQNWASSQVAEGTPGRPNSVLATNLAPVVTEVGHQPPVPRSVDPVRIVARIEDEQPPATVSVCYRVDAVVRGPFLRVPMFDDGLHEDGAAADGVYAATLPAQANHAVVEFYVQAVDRHELTRTWPAPAIELDGSSLGQAANLLYQVDDAPQGGPQPIHKLIMTENERAELALLVSQAPDNLSDAQMNATFLTVEGGQFQVHHLCGLRNRGHGSRTRIPHNYRVNLRSDDRWNGRSAININGQYTYLQHFGAALCLATGLPGGEARPVQVRVNNANLGNNGPETYAGTYVANEVLNSEFAEHRFPDDSSGNLYRCVRTDSTPRINADLSYRGADPAAYTNTYFKETNASENDYSDLIELTRTLTETPDTQFATEIRRVVDVDQWLTYLAAMALLNSRETGPNTGDGDDYAIYRGVADPRFVLLYYDLDTIVSQGAATSATNATLFGAAALPVFGRLLNHPEFQTRYYQTLERLIDTTFSAAQFNALVDQTLAGYVPEAVLQSMKDWMQGRRAYVRSQLPAGLPPYRLPVASVTGAPRSPTPLRSATLQVGGEGVTHYRYRLNDGAYGPEVPVATPIQLAALPTPGTNVVTVIGRTASGFWQPESNATRSLQWIINPAWPSVRLNEVLALNRTVFNHEGTFPDYVELLNEGEASVDLSGLRLTDNLDSPSKFTIPSGTSLEAGARLLLLANNPDGTSGLHLGFGLDQAGEGVHLFDRVDRGGAMLDTVRFGTQLPDHAIGRVHGGDWVLTLPTPGNDNLAAVLGDIQSLKINEWLAEGRTLVLNDFVELFNPSPAPVALGGLFFTDNLVAAPQRHRIPDLTFIPAAGYAAFRADGDPEQGADHLGFKLAVEQGEIGLSEPGGWGIDRIVYGPQSADISQGRSPNGSAALLSFLSPTPGAPNPGYVSVVTTQTVALVTLTNAWRYHQTADLTGTTWTDRTYDDAAWPAGAALLGVESDPLPVTINTPLTLGRRTYYFRTRFNWDGAAGDVVLRLRTVVDDGAVLYLNGAPLHAVGMPTDTPIIYDTAASRTVDNAVLEGPWSLSAAGLRIGENVLAVEVHQVNSGSTDIAFSLSLDAVATTTPPADLHVVLNEVLANAQSDTNFLGRAVDWIELHNPATNTVDLADLSLSDAVGEPRRWVFPPGTTLAPGASLVLLADPDQPASATNTALALGADGDALHLFERPADGGAPIDTLRFGRQPPDLSLARIPAGVGAWQLAVPTPGAANLAAALGDPSRLRLNEWNAAVSGGSDWFELHNPNTQPVDLSRFSFTDSATSPERSPIPDLTFIGSGTHGYQPWIADGSPTQGADHVNFDLPATGGSLILMNRDRAVVDAVSRGPQTGPGSRGRFPDDAPSIVAFPTTASPGFANHLPLEDLVINEVLAHTDPPLEDAVEIRNLSSQPVDVGGWFLSDDPSNPAKYRIPQPTLVPAGGYHVFYEGLFNAETNLPTSFSFSSARGDEVVLTAADSLGRLTGYRATAAFGASANGVSFGRVVTSVGVDFAPLVQRTFGADAPATVEQFRSGSGAPNSGPRVGPVVLNEIMFRPPDLPGPLDNTEAEYLELLNTTATTVPLYDPAAPSNTWKLSGGVGFQFPRGISLAPGAFALVVGFDPTNNPSALASFLARYAVPAPVRILGPYTGRLDNDGEPVELQRPDPPQLPPLPDAGYVPYPVVERIRYAATTPWPLGASGTGDSLQRLAAAAYGNDPIQWTAAAPTPGRPNGSAPADTDGDGLPNDWETAHLLDPQIATGDDGALGDPDDDGLTNLQEYRSGTDPRDASSALRLDARPGPAGESLVSFRAIAGHTYSLFYRDDLIAGDWLKWQDVPAPAVSGGLEFPDPTAVTAGVRFYRLVTPAQP